MTIKSFKIIKVSIQGGGAILIRLLDIILNLKLILLWEESLLYQ